VNGAEFVDDPERGTVLSVDGSTFVEIDHAADIAFTDVDNDTMSMAVWVKPTVVPNPGWHTILVKNRDVHFDNAFGIFHNGANYHFRFGDKTFNADNAATDEWKHLVLTYDGPTTTMRGYVDGAMVGEQTESPGTVGESTLVIGAGRDHGGDHPPFEFFTGLIDDVAIYSRVLDQADLDALAGGGVITAVEPCGKLATTWGGLREQ
jgi:hypothetical protein